MNPDEQLTAARVAGQVDISCVQAHHTAEDVRALADTAIRFGFVSAHVLPNRLRELRELLSGSTVHAGSPVGFPSGGASPGTKLFEARELMEAGAQELDVVIDIGRLRSAETRFCFDEVSAITDFVAGRVPTRLILEVSRLNDDEIRRGCDVAMEAGFDFVKTGTGWAGSTTPQQARVIADHVAGAIAIKAAGGIRTIDDLRTLAGLGVTRFGINDAVATTIVRDLAAAEAAR